MTTRRRLLRDFGRACVGVGGLPSATAAVLAPPDGERDGATAGERAARIRHTLELPGVRERAAHAAREREPTRLFARSLVEHLHATREERGVSVVVDTVGEPASVAGRTGRIDGWRPTGEEVALLSAYGDIGFTATYSGTAVSLRHVDRRDLPRLAGHERVLRVRHDPPVAPGGGRHTGGGPVAGGCDDGPALAASALRSGDYCGFAEVGGDEGPAGGSRVTVGVADTGYEAARTAYGAAYADAVGVDAARARDFTSDGDWSRDSWSVGDCFSHGTTVADTAAFALGGSGDAPVRFVPLKIWSDAGSIARSTDRLRAAIEYAAREGIGLLNVSAGFLHDATDYCTAQFCDVLEAYAATGGVVVSTTGNGGRDARRAVQQPGGSWFAVGVGGVGVGRCDDGALARHPASAYAPRYDYAACDWCRDHAGVGSCPSVYGAYAVETDAGTVASGTSFAAPFVTAAAALARSGGDAGLERYRATRALFRGMGDRAVCPPPAARAGGLVDAAVASRARAGTPGSDPDDGPTGDAPAAVESPVR